MKNKVLLSLLTAILLFSFINIEVYADSSIKAITDFEGLEGEAKYIKDSYRNNYYLDIEETGLLEAGDEMLNGGANVLFAVAKHFSYLVVSVFYHAMSFDLANLFEPEINGIQTALKESVFDTFFILAFCGSAWALALKLAKRDLSGIVMDSIKILIIMMISSFVVTNASTAISGATNITKQISTTALMNVNGQGDVEIKSYAANTAGMLWKSLVHAPWKSLQFSETAASDEDVEDFMSAQPGSDERKELVKEYKEKYEEAFDKKAGGGRIGFLIVYLIPLVVKGGIFLFVAILQLGFQLMAVFYVLLAPIILLLALIPSFGGIEMVSGWLKKIFETQVMIVIITFLMGVIIKLDTFLYDRSSEWGWFVVIIIETVISLIVVFNYKGILKGMNKVTQGVQRPGSVKYQMARSGNVFGALGSGASYNLRKKRSQNYSKALTPVVVNKPNKDKDDDNSNSSKNNEAKIEQSGNNTSGSRIKKKSQQIVKTRRSENPKSPIERPKTVNRTEMNSSTNRNSFETNSERSTKPRKIGSSINVQRNLIHSSYNENTYNSSTPIKKPTSIESLNSTPIVSNHTPNAKISPPEKTALNKNKQVRNKKYSSRQRDIKKRR